MEDLVSLCIESHIAHLWINRPTVRNALSFAVLKKMHGFIHNIDKDKNIRALIISGVGEKAFSAGADLKERQTMNLDETRAFIDSIQDLFEHIASLPMPTIAALNGDAFGGGLELALACDLRLCSRDAKMGLTECSLGIIPGAGGTQRLLKIVSVARAMELIFLARKLDAQEALSYGLVNAVADKSDVISLAQEYAQKIAKNAPLAIREAKRSILFSQRRFIKEELEVERLAYERVLDSEDRKEGLRAFLEKRSPSYKGM